MSSLQHVLNGLTDEYAEIFGPKYSQLYREHIAGRRLAHDMTIEEYRAEPVLLSFGAPSTPGPESVGSVKEISIPVEGGEIPALVYYPKDYKQGDILPSYVNYHGGGWVIGDIRDDETFGCKVVQECNCIVVDVGYRLAPEFRYPIPVLDSWTAYKYVVENSKELGVDPSRVAVGGFSAGGQISAVICQRARDEGYSHPPCFQLLVIPVCDATALDTNLDVAKDCPYNSWREHFYCPFLSHARMSWFYRYFLPETVEKKTLSEPLLSPLKSSSLANLPPALVVPAEVDVLRDEGIAYARRLGKENDSWTELWLAKRVPHPFPHQTEATDIAVAFEELAVQRLNQAFAGKLQKGTFISNI